MVDFVQRITGLPGKLGVQRQYLDGELHLVDNALSGAVATTEQFEVRDIVVGSNAVDVVDGFFGEKFASDMFGHDPAVFEHISGRVSVFSRDNQTGVAPPSSMSSWTVASVFRLVRYSAKQRPAFGAAQKFFSVNSAARLSLDGHGFAALDAANIPFIFGNFFGFAHAFARTVQWVFAKLFQIGTSIARLHAECFAANGAVKIYFGNARIGATKQTFVRSFARPSAKFLAGISRTNFEVLATTFANFFDRHAVLSCSSGRAFVARYVG